MRLLKLLVLAVIAVALILVGIANRDPATVRLVPPELGVAGDLSITAPLFVILLGALVVGLLIGLVLEWVRERKHHRVSAERRREVGVLRAELEKREAASQGGAPALN